MDSWMVEKPRQGASTPEKSPRKVKGTERVIVLEGSYQVPVEIAMTARCTEEQLNTAFPNSPGAYVASKNLHKMPSTLKGTTIDVAR